MSYTGTTDTDPQGNQRLVRENPDNPLSTKFANEEFEQETLFQNAHALTPPSGEPRKLNDIYRESYPLRVCIEAIRTNTATHGFSIEPVVDLDNPDHLEDYRTAINLAFEMGEDAYVREGAILRSVDHQEVTPADMPGFASDFEVSDQQFEDATKRLKKRQKADEFRLKAFIGSCCPNSSFHKIRGACVSDYEIHGYAFWEVVLSTDGEETPLQLVHVPSWTMRLLPLELSSHSTEITYQVSPAIIGTKEVHTRYRLYAQRDETSGNLVYYKMLGDDRVYSSCTGLKYADLEAILRAEKASFPNVRAANAMLHFSQYDPESPYGTPRWWGTLNNVNGTMAAEAVNERFFDNKTIPAGLLAITNGVANQEDLEKVKKDWTDEVKGIENFHNLMILHVDGMEKVFAPTSQGAKVEFIPLNSANPSDGQFLEYLNRNQDVIGMAFRLGRPVRGDMRDLNRATARVSIQLAEKQVFQPERASFDEIFNKRLLPLLGIHNVRFRSNPPDMTDPEEVLKLLDTSSKGGVMTVEESRMVAGMLTGKDFRKVEGEWGKLPMRMVLGGFRTDDSGKIVPIVEPSTGAPTPRANPKAEGGENKDT